MLSNRSTQLAKWAINRQLKQKQLVRLMATAKSFVSCRVKNRTVYDSISITWITKKIDGRLNIFFGLTNERFTLNTNILFLYMYATLHIDTFHPLSPFSAMYYKILFVLQLVIWCGWKRWCTIITNWLIHGSKIKYIQKIKALAKFRK